MEFEIRSKFGMLKFKLCLTDRNEILHTSRQLHCRDVYKFLLWSVVYILNQSTANFGRISNSIEMSLVGGFAESRMGLFSEKHTETGEIW